MVTQTQVVAALQQRIHDRAIIRSKYSESQSQYTEHPLVIRSSQGRLQDWLVDIRALALNTDDLDLLATVFWEVMHPHFPFQLGGLELGAVPLLAGIVIKGKEYGVSVNSFVVRKSRKKSGLCQQVEGAILDDVPIVIVDDLVNSSDSIQRVAIVLKDHHRRINHVFSYLSFDNPAASEFFERENIRYSHIFSLTDFGITTSPPQPSFPPQQTLDIAWQFSPETVANYTLSVPHSAPVVDSKHVYFGADDSRFYAVNKTTGQRSWQFNVGKTLKGILSSPAWVDDSVIFGAYDGMLYRLRCKDGSPIWQSPLAEFIGSSPCVVEPLQRVFIGLEHSIFQQWGELAAVDLATGDKIWGLKVSEYIHSTPVYDALSHRVFVGCNDGNLYAADADTGHQQWVFATDGAIKVAPTLDPKRQQVIAPSFDGHCYGIDIHSGKKNFCLSADFGFYNTALVHEDRLYIGCSDKHFYIYDLNHNRLLKKLPVMGRIFSSPQWIHSSIWFGANDGFIRQVSPDGDYLGGILLSERPLTPIVYDQALDCYFVVTMGNHLLCLR